MEKKFGIFTSSFDPAQFSLTVSSAVRIIGSVAAGYAAIRGINMTVTDAQIKAVADAFTLIATSAIAIWHSADFLYGLFRKFTVKK